MSSSRRFPLVRSAVAIASIGLALTATACTPTVSLEPAPHADAAGCADLMTSNLPSPLSGQKRVWTDAQSTAAWGADPTAIILTCGVEEPVASELPCQTVAGIDWLAEEIDGGYKRFTSFGRSPAVQIFVDPTQYIDPADVLTRLAKSMREFEHTRSCSEKIPG